MATQKIEDKATAVENLSIEEQKNKKLKALEKARLSINKRLAKDFPEEGPNLITNLGAEPIKIKRVSTNSLVIDSVIGGGIPQGRVVEIFGPEASGKTSVCLSVVGNYQKQGSIAAYIDLEHAMDPNYAKVLGVNVDELIFAQPSSAEAAMETVKDLIPLGVVDVIVVDSVGAMVTRMESEGVAGDVKMAPVARLLSQECKKIAGLAAKHDVTVIFVNQLRSNIGGYGNPETTPGGKALKYTASLRLDVRRREFIYEGSGDNKRVVGTKIRVKSVKNKVAPPMKMGETVISNRYGIDPKTEIMEIGEELGVLYREGNRNWFETETGEQIGNSKGAAEEEIRSNPELTDRLMEAVRRVYEERNGMVEEKPQEDEE